MKKNHLKVAVVGASGRMGQELYQSLLENKNTIPFLGVVRSQAQTNFEITAHNFDNPSSKQIDVIIDFSTKENFLKLLAQAVKQKKPFVSGVTGLDQKDFAAIKAAGKKIPVLWAPNMSFGLAALRKAMSIAQELEGFDFQIEEIHHRHKKDRPSGTALSLQQDLQKLVSVKVPEPLVVRGGGVFGVHKIWMMSDDEVISFEHQALNRKVFANGAIRAAIWLTKQKPGVYKISDLFRGQL